MTTTTSRFDTALSDLADHLRGRLVRPGDADYDSSRAVWNGMHDRHPAAVARCAGTGDVLTALRFALDHELPVALRGGGHSIPGFSTFDDGMVIDLSPMHGVVVDPAARVAYAQATAGAGPRARNGLGQASCSTSNSASLDADERPSRISRPQSRTKMR